MFLKNWMKWSLGLSLGCILVSGCSTHQGEETKFLQALAQGNPAMAEKELDAYWLDSKGQIKYKKDDLLYYMDKGVFTCLEKDYKRSIEALNTADRRAAELAPTSVSRTAGTFMLNDLTTEYGGQDYERALVHYYMALGYLLQGNLEDTLVECRRIDEMLRKFNQDYGDKKSVYKEDAFLQYLSGVCYEAQGNLNDALISYKLSWEAYKDYTGNYGTVPFPELPRDLLRCTEALGMNDQLQDWQKAFPGIEAPKQDMVKKYGQVVVILEHGPGAFKREKSITIPGPAGMVKLDIPEYEIPRSSFGGAQLLIDGKARVQTALVENVAAIAVKDLQDHMARIMVKLIARTVAKQAAAIAAQEEVAKKAGDTAGRLTGFLVGTAGAAVEKADTRSWMSLPAGIDLARVLVEPGSHEVTLNIVGGGPVSLGTANLKAGEFAFYLYRFQH